MSNLLTAARVSPSVAAALGHLARETFSAAFAAQNKPEDMQDYLTRYLSDEQLLRELENPLSQYWWWLDQEQPVAFCKLNFAGAQSDLQDPESLEIERLYTLASWQGRGLGAQMLQHAETIARQHQLQYMWLGVWEHNTRAIAFYQRHGFEKFATHPFLLGNDLQTDWLMKKKL